MANVAELKLALELEHAEVLLLRQERDALTAEVDRLRYWREDAEAVHEAVCADLARVTKERDMLLRDARRLLAAPRPFDAEFDSAYVALGGALAACTPGEEQDHGTGKRREP